MLMSYLSRYAYKRRCTGSAPLLDSGAASLHSIALLQHRTSDNQAIHTVTLTPFLRAHRRSVQLSLIPRRTSARRSALRILLDNAQQGTRHQKLADVQTSTSRNSLPV
jgi:hypothetical protein